MKVIFLDIDGVLNNKSTKDTFKFKGWNMLGLDKDLLSLFKKWLAKRSVYKIVLSSTWRLHQDAREELKRNGIYWIDVTPGFGIRGKEVSVWLNDNPEVTNYAILDDNDEFSDIQQSHFVQTDPALGITQDDLDKIDKILS